MSFGGQTVYFVTVAEDPTVRDRYNNPTLVRTQVGVPGCRFRPLSAQEKIELGDIVTDPWKCTAPPKAAVINARSGDEVLVGGVTYQILGGPRVFPDMQGTLFKVTIICERRGV